MTRLAAYVLPSSRHSLTSVVKALFFGAAVLAAATCFAQAHGAETTKPTANSCATFGDAFDDGADIHAMDAYRAAVGQHASDEKNEVRGWRLAVARLLQRCIWSDRSCH